MLHYIEPAIELWERAGRTESVASAINLHSMNIEYTLLLINYLCCLSNNIIVSTVVAPPPS